MRSAMKFVLSMLPGILLLTAATVRAEYLRDSKGNFVRYAGAHHAGKIMLQDVPARRNELRGVWIAVVENIDFPRCRTAAEFKQQFRTRVQKLRAAGFTAVIFQVRSNCDAFYPSRLAPYSRWMTGREGVGFKDFDPLRFMVDETHRHGMEFHAWFNPYRVENSTPLSKTAYLKTLAANNFARRNPQWVLAQKNGKNLRLFLDPGEPRVIQHVSAVVHEVVSRYPVDAIHFDDYFYPYEKLGREDDRSFARYNPRRLNRDSWRRSNTDALILAVRRTIDSANQKRQSKARFGISPFGIWANYKTNRFGSLTGGKESYSIICADTRKWVQYRAIDYITPQIYWHFGHEQAAYAALVDWWCSVVRGTGVKLYIGMGAYRANSPGWNNYELVNQMRFNRMKPEVSGTMFFSYRSLFSPPVKPGAAALLRYLKK